MRRKVAISQNKPIIPKLPAARSFALLFLPLWIVLFGASWGVSYGWMKYMQDCCEGTKDKQSFTYLEWIISSVIFLWTTLALAAKLYRFRLLVQIINSFMRLADSLFLNSSDATIAANSALVFETLQYTPDGGKQKLTFNLDFSEALAETMMALICSALILVYELVYTNKLDGFVVDLVEELMLKQLKSSSSMLFTLFKNEKNDQQRSAGEKSYSTIMLHVINERVLGMGTRCSLVGTQTGQQIQVQIPQMMLTVQSVLTDIANLIEMINNFKDLPSMLSEEWWISWPIMFIGIVFPFLIPPVFFSTMGSHILFIGPVIFFFIGSPVLINIVLGDPIQRPTHMHMQRVYDQLNQLGDKIQYQFKTKFAPYIELRQLQLQNSLVAPIVQLQQQPQQPQQQQNPAPQPNLVNPDQQRKYMAQISRSSSYINTSVFDNAIQHWMAQPYSSEINSSSRVL